jgi:hypothetical protein
VSQRFVPFLPDMPPSCPAFRRSQRVSLIFPGILQCFPAIKGFLSFFLESCNATPHLTRMTTIFLTTIFLGNLTCE